MVDKLYRMLPYIRDVFSPLTSDMPLPPQLKTTSMHLHNIFNVPQVVSETYDLIKDGRLLEAHRKYVGEREREREKEYNDSSAQVVLF